MESLIVRIFDRKNAEMINLQVKHLAKADPAAFMSEMLTALVARKVLTVDDAETIGQHVFNACEDAGTADAIERWPRRS